jgi:hypothetical protein
LIMEGENDRSYNLRGEEIPGRNADDAEEDI